MNKLTTVTAGLLIIAMMVVLNGCRDKESPVVGSKVPVLKGLGLMSVTESLIPDQIELVGTVRAKNSAVIAGRIAGVVKTLSVKEGDRVSKGKVLMTLDAVESTAGADAAAAVVEEAKRAVDEAVARKRFADTTFERYKKLYSEQAVTRQELDSRQSDKDVATQALARAEAHLNQAREGARAAGAVSGYTRITAPISGLITARPVDVGMTVFPGTPLLTVEDEGNYRLEVAVPETYLGRITAGNTLPVVVEGIRGEMTGRVEEVVPVVDPLSRTFTAKLGIVAKGLRSGVYGRALFSVALRKGVLIPKNAVMERGALVQIWVVERDNTVRLRLVKLGRVVGDKVEVLAGLSTGERIVTGGLERVVEGARVE